MGTFRVKIEVGDVDGQRWESVDALVDTGASFTVVPASILRRVGILPRERWPFELADGRRVEKEIGDARVRVDGRAAPTLVVFGDEMAEALLGAHSLQGLLLAPDPINHRLIPVPGLLKPLQALKTLSAGGYGINGNSDVGALDCGIPQRLVY